MSTGMESPQSSSIVGYYKGFSVTVTKRDMEAEIKPFIESAMKAIDYMVNQGFKPSWNEDTNKEHNPSTAWQDDGKAREAICAECGGKAIIKSGVSKKNNKKWTGVFCQENKEHVSWGN